MKIFPATDAGPITHSACSRAMIPPEIIEARQAVQRLGASTSTRFPMPHRAQQSQGIKKPNLASLWLSSDRPRKLCPHLRVALRDIIIAAHNALNQTKRTQYPKFHIRFWGFSHWNFLLVWLQGNQIRYVPVAGTCHKYYPYLKRSLRLGLRVSNHLYKRPKTLFYIEISCQNHMDNLTFKLATPSIIITKDRDISWQNALP